jgi:hypothetical protein
MEKKESEIAIQLIIFLKNKFTYKNRLHFLIELISPQDNGTAWN